MDSAKSHSDMLHKLSENLKEDRKKLSNPASVPKESEEERSKKRLLADVKR
jgi:hypothetical protein